VFISAEETEFVSAKHCDFTGSQFLAHIFEQAMKVTDKACQITYILAEVFLWFNSLFTFDMMHFVSIMLSLFYLECEEQWYDFSFLRMTIMSFHDLALVHYR
jgi:hypothetical protein